MRIGILGGGLGGLSLQRFLNHDSLILEKEDRTGGLGRSFTKEGFTYDIGGHILFSKNQKIMDFVQTVLAGNMNNCRRNNQILFKDRYIKYPFENGLASLDKEDIFDCLNGYLFNNNPKPTNFQEWIYYTFGNGLARHYLLPYNEKIWKMPLSEMGTEWVERVPKPPESDVIKSALGIETEGYLHQLYFHYPTHGGIEGFVQAAANPAGQKICGFSVQRIDKKGSGWIVSDGRVDHPFDRLVVAFPLKEAIRCFQDVPEDVMLAVKNLKYNSIRIILLGINNASLMDKSAVYIPDPSVWAHRVCYMGFFSKNNVPEGKSSLIAEITAPPGHELYSVSDEVLTENVIQQLHRINILRKEDVITTDAKIFEYGYVLYDRDYTQNIRKIRAYFDSIQVPLLGRFAEFEYVNMDEVLRRSMNLAETLNQLPA